MQYPQTEQIMNNQIQRMTGYNQTSMCIKDVPFNRCPIKKAPCVKHNTRLVKLQHSYSLCVL